MAFVDYGAKEIRNKIVYWGPSGSGKWSNLAWIYAKTGAADRPVPAKAESIGFPLSLGDIRGFKNTLSLYRVPGEGPVRWVLDQAEPGPVDGIVFVADASPDAAARNTASLRSLVEEVAVRSFDVGKLPFVLQYNKRDLPGAATPEQLRAALNPWGHPEIEAIAAKGIGVFESLKSISKQVLEQLRKPG
jgi:signal recognition particle receptor subunit beta